MKAGYSIAAPPVALVAATAKSVVGVQAPSQFGVDLRAIELGFDGVTASDASVLIELCYATFATNPPGTNSTSATVRQLYGRSITAGFAGAYNWTSEPTVLTVIREFPVTPNAGTLIHDIPFDSTPDSAVSEGFVLRMTAPTNAVNVRGATLRFERC